MGRTVLSRHVPAIRTLALAVLLAALLTLADLGIARAQDEGTLRDQAVQLIDQYGPQLSERALQRFYAVQEQRLVLLANVVTTYLPLLGFVAVLLYPLYAGDRIRARLPNPPMSRLYSLYAIQAVIVLLALFIIGLVLSIFQLFMGALGQFTNPQYVLERETIGYVVENRQELVDSYTPIFVGVADSLVNDPEATMLTIMIDNARQIREDPFLGTSMDLIELAWPLMSNFFLFGLLLLLYFFLRRLWPIFLGLLRYPLEILDGERTGRQVLSYAGTMSMPRERTAARELWAAGFRAIGTEVKVGALSLVVGFLLVLVMSNMLVLFLTPLAQVLVILTSLGVNNFVTQAGSASTIGFALILMLCYVVETLFLYSAAFAGLMGKSQHELRQHFIQRIPWQPTWRAIGRHCWSFIKLTGMMALMSFALIFIGAMVTRSLDSGDSLTLLGVPLITLVGFNLGMLFFKGFATLQRLVLGGTGGATLAQVAAPVIGQIPPGMPPQEQSGWQGGRPPQGWPGGPPQGQPGWLGGPPPQGRPGMPPQGQPGWQGGPPQGQTGWQGGAPPQGQPAGLPPGMPPFQGQPVRPSGPMQGGAPPPGMPPQGQPGWQGGPPPPGRPAGLSPAADPGRQPAQGVPPAQPPEPQVKPPELES